MKVNLHNIVSTAIERGLIDGYRQITANTFQGDADTAVDRLYDSVWHYLQDVVNFKDEEEEKQARKIGFEHTSLVSDAEIEPDVEEEGEPGMRQNRHRKQAFHNKPRVRY